MAKENEAPRKGDEVDGAKEAKKEEPELAEEELSEEDQKLSDDLGLMVQRAQDADAGVAALAIESLGNEIRTATSSMTSVPKPLKFLRPHYPALRAKLEATPAGAPNRQPLADVVSVLAMTSADEGSRETLKYKLQGAPGDVAKWGHEYIRHLAGEIGEEYEARRGAEQPVDDLMALVDQIVPYDMTHNAEPEAVDLLLEVERIEALEAHADAGNAARTCLYLLGCSAYLAEPEDAAVLRTAFNIYSKVGKHSDALRMALKLGSRELAEQAFAGAPEPWQKKQLAYILGRHGLALNLEDGPAAVADDDLREHLVAIISNTRLSEQYLALARDLDVMEAKTPEDVYKMHLVEGRAPTGPAVDSARANLAATFVNAFVNAGFGQDKLMTVQSEDEKVHWIFKNKDHGKMSATASLGTVLLWDVEGGLPQIDRFLYSTDPQVVAGALLAVGIVSCGVQDEVDPALALLSEYVGKEDVQTRIGAVLGLGIAYAGREKEEVAELLLPLVLDGEAPMEVAATAALALGLVYQGTANGDAVEAVLQALMLRGEADLQQPGGRLMCLALGLLYLHRQNAVDATLEVAKTLDEKVSKFLQAVLDACAYAGTGDVLKVQQLLALCGERIEADGEAASWKTLHQSMAVLGLGLLATSEELGAQMAHRALEHLLQYGEPAVRRAVPLALALLNVSNPDMTVMDTLSRLSHDTDADVAMNAVLALGLIGAGTNNARLAGMLRQLSSYYYKEPTLLFLVRVAQGLVHMGKGLLTLNPYHSDHQLLNGTALAGILAVLVAGGLDMKATLAGKAHYLLYCLTPAMKPRMLMTVDEEGQMLPVPVRVGTAVDTVAQAGRPKTITGFQTHTTPVLLSVGERAELGTEKYLPATGTLEGVVILRENPEYVEMHE